MKRIHVLISGRVQGVFFRAFVKENADELGLSGWVKNTFDGKVEAEFEGEDSKVDKLIQLCKKGPPPAVVEKVEVKEVKYKGSMASFEIRH